MNIELIGWVATMLLLVGYYLNAKKLLVSWIIWIIGNSAMAVYAYMIDSMSVVTLSVVLVGLNLYGYKKWKTDK